MKASVLIVTLMILSITLITALSMALVSGRERKASIESNKSSIAYQIAETGIESVMQLIVDNSSKTLASIDSNCDGVMSVDIDAAKKYSVELQDSSGNKITGCSTPIASAKFIKSVGTVVGQAQRAIRSVVITVNSIPNPSFEDDPVDFTCTVTAPSANDTRPNKWGKGSNPATCADKKSYVTIDSEHWDGSNSIKIDTRTSAAGVLNVETAPEPSSPYYIPISSNTKYTLSVYTKGGPGRISIYERDSGRLTCTSPAYTLGGACSSTSGAVCAGDGTAYHYADFPGSAEWTKQTLTYKSGTCPEVNIFLQQTKTSPIGSDPVYYDMAKLVQSP